MDESRPGVVAATSFMIASFPLRLAQFVAIVTLIVVGLATTPMWIGVPILLAATVVVRWFGDLERGWVSKMIGYVPPAQRKPESGGALRRWRSQLTDPSTWRDLGYLMLVFPLGIIEFVLAIAGLVLVPISLFVVPWLGWLHAQLATALLGPDKARRAAARAAHLQASRARGVDAAEAERRRIERDLHDGAQQRLVTLAMTLGHAKSRMASDPAAARALLDDAHSDAKIAVAELRDLARGIYPAVLGDRGLDAALSAQAAKSPVPVTVTIEPELTQQRPPHAVETCAYFIVCEALTNVAKHSGAASAQVNVSRNGDGVTVEVVDNGVGGAEVKTGGGLAGLADRAATIDGVVTVVSPTGGPTVLRADLPTVW